MAISRKSTIITGAVALVLIIGIAAVSMWYTNNRAKRLAKLAFPEWVQYQTENLSWKDRTSQGKLTEEILQKSLQLGRSFLLENQKPAGNFQYMYDWKKGKYDRSDNQVRQAGALWGLASIHRNQPTAQTAAAVEKGLDFFFSNSVSQPTGELVIVYPGDTVCKSGTAALVALAIIEYLRSDPGPSPGLKKELKQKLDGYIAFLKMMRNDSGGFSQWYSVSSRRKANSSSPYFDGESLLALTKAARYAGYSDLISLIEDSAPRLAEKYTRKAWKKEFDSDMTKGFFQWGSMSFWEYYQAGWKNADLMADVTVLLSWWMIHVHHTLSRTRNTAYAYEGIVSAYDIAKARSNEEATRDLGYVIDRGLYKLTTWQIGGPLADKNSFLRSNPTDDKKAIGGVMNIDDEPPLRIDVTQHQMHAVILALDHYFSDK